MEITSVTINIPNSSFSTLDSASQKSSDVVAMDNDFGVTLPTQTSELNCYMVTVSGPEQGLSNSQCNIGQSSPYKIPVGLANGFVSSGKNIQFEVPAGDKRVFSLIGLKTDGTIPCPAVRSFDGFKTHISQPVLIGKTVPTQLLAGASVNLDIILDTVVTENNLVEDCTGPAFGNSVGSGPNGGGGGVSGTPAGYTVKTQANLTSFTNASCVPMQLKIVDSTGNGASVTGEYRVTLSANNGVEISINENCDPSSNSNTFIFSSFNTRMFFAKIPLTGTGSFKFATSDSSGAISLPNGNLATNYSYSAVSGNVTLNLVEKFTLNTLGRGNALTVPAYQCRTYYLQGQDSLGRPVNIDSSSSSGSFSITTDMMKIYSDQDCTSTSGNISISNESITNKAVYGIFTAPESSVTFTPPTLLGSSPAITNPDFSVTVSADPGTATQLGFVRSEQNYFLSTNTFYFKRPTSGCQVIGEISYFTAAGARTILPGAGGTINISPSSSGVLYFDSNCSSTDLNTYPTQTVTNSNNKYKIPIYSKSTAPTQSYTLTIDATSLFGASNTSTINFNVSR